MNKQNGRVWIVLDNSALGVRIKGGKTTANITAGRYQARYVDHPITLGRSALEVFDDEENPVYLVVETLPGQGVNLTIEDIGIVP